MSKILEKRPEDHALYGKYEAYMVTHRDEALNGQGVIIPITIMGHFNKRIVPSLPVWLPVGVVAHIKHNITQTKWRIKKKQVQTVAGFEWKDAQEAYQVPLYNVTLHGDTGSATSLVIKKTEEHSTDSLFGANTGGE